MLALKGKSPELCVYGEVGSPDAKNPVTIASVRDALDKVGDALDKVGDAPEMVVRFNSVGGSVTEGMAIYSALREFPGRKVGIVEGLAASIASVILMACDEVVMTKGSFLMVHNPFAVAQGESGDLRRTADLLDEMRQTMLQIYQEATGLPMAELEAMVDKETYLSADEAVRLGFADRVSDTGARIAASAVRLLANPPEALRKVALAKEESAMEEEMKKMKAALAASEEECKALKAKLAKFEKKDDDDSDDEDEESSTGTGEGAKASLQMARVVLAASEAYGETDPEVLEGHIKAGRPSASAGSRKDLVARAMASGRLPPALKAWAMSCPAKALQSFLKDSPAEGPGAPVLREPDLRGSEATTPSKEELRVARAFARDQPTEVHAKRAADAKSVTLPGPRSAE